jgi:hypothetical protein
VFAYRHNQCPATKPYKAKNISYFRVKLWFHWRVNKTMTTEKLQKPSHWTQECETATLLTRRIRSRSYLMNGFNLVWPTLDRLQLEPDNMFPEVVTFFSLIKTLNDDFFNEEVCYEHQLYNYKITDYWYLVRHSYNGQIRFTSWQWLQTILSAFAIWY